MNTPLLPIEIRRTGSEGVSIRWTDGSTQELSSSTLRRNCPCAECREKRGDSTHEKPLSPKKGALRIVQNTLQDELTLLEVWGVGQYAVGLRWKDGHTSGIYTFDYLRSL